MSVMQEVDAFEFWLHVVTLILSMAVVAFSLMTYLRIREKLFEGAFKSMVMMFTIALLLSAFRWVGGTLARLYPSLLGSDVGIILFIIAGVGAAIFALAGLLKMNEFIQYNIFTRPKK